MTATALEDIPAAKGPLSAILIRIAALGIVAAMFAFLINNYLTLWQDWPGISGLFAHLGWFGAETSGKPLEGGGVTLGWIQLLLYDVLVGLVAVYTFSTGRQPLRVDSARLSAMAAFIIRAAFWSVLLIGLVDTVISFMRVEGFLASVFGQKMETNLGLSEFRGTYVHCPLIAVSLFIAAFTRSLGFTWLALLVVVAELQIVIARFIFSYEQAFMGDLVRFWYAALFLFASAYTLIEEGHVRVDIIYAGMSERRKAWSNVIGSILLGVPLCWIIMTSGMWDKSNLINAPLLSFEVTQSGYGLYVKYLMAGFLLIYALTMMMQFLGYTLRNAAVLANDPDARPVGASHGAP